MNRSTASTSWLFKMAWRDARASRSRLLLFMSSIVLGIAAVVAIQLFSTNLVDNIKRQSKSLMGADFIIETDQIPNETAQGIIDSLRPDAREVNFVSMIAFPKNDATKLVKVRGIKGPFPFYGKLETTPQEAATNYIKAGEALVDATLLLQYNIQVGDRIKIGELTVPIAGSLDAIPGSSAVTSSVAPTVVLPYDLIEKTQLLQFGSRKEYQFFYNRPTANLELLESKVEPILDQQDADLDTHTSTSRRLGRRYENVGSFLNLAAFIALLLGCVGIASSVNIYIKEKLAAVAVLKCMGASRRQSFLIFLIQIACIGLLGGIIGTAIGVGLQELLPVILQEFLPFDLTIKISVQPIAIGISLGVIMSVLFALLPLLRTWYVSPLQVLRSSNEEEGHGNPLKIGVISAVFVFLFGFTYWLLEDFKYAIYFIIGVLVTFAILAGIAILTMKLVKKYFPKNAKYTWRQSLLNLYRPNNQTVVLLVAIGLGTFLISTLYFTKDVLLSKAQITASQQTANLILLDIQPNQLESVKSTLEKQQAPVIDNIALVTMRMQRIKDKSVASLRTDTTTRVRRWILNHEFRTTYRDSLMESEELMQGEWVANFENQDGPVPISISDNLANDAQVTIGDEIIFNVQGVFMPTKVASIRKVDWANLQLNFSVVFPVGVLENAPQFNVLTTQAKTPQQSALLQQELVKRVPNVTIIDLRQVYTVVEDILSKVSWIINFMAFFSILTGIIVLIGSVRTSKYQRIKESVLLRTIGAQNIQILQISALEYALLGIIGSLVGIVLAMVSSFLLALFVFKEPFVPSIIPFIVFLPGITILVLAIGLSNIRSVLRSSPLEVLRKAS